MYCTLLKQLAGHWHDRAFSFNERNDKMWVVRGTERREFRKAMEYSNTAKIYCSVLCLVHGT